MHITLRITIVPGFTKVRFPISSISILPAGTYRFYYKGANNDGVWNEVSSTFVDHHKTPFLSNNSFYLLVISLITLLVLSYVLYRWYIKKQFEKQKQLSRYSQSNLNEKEAQGN